MKVSVKSVMLAMVMLLVFALPVFAKDFPAQTNVPIDKEWKITFNQTIDSNATQYISLYRTDVSPETKVDISVWPEGTKAVVIKHETPFVAGASYRLTVGGEASSVSGIKISDSANLCFETVAESVSHIADDAMLEEMQSYISSKYRSTVIDEHTIRYSIAVVPYTGNLDGTHIGSAFIILNTTQDTIWTQGHVVAHHYSGYTDWLAVMLNDIQARYGEYEYNGGVWTSLTGNYVAMFDNWSGNWRFTMQ